MLRRLFYAAFIMAGVAMFSLLIIAVTLWATGGTFEAAETPETTETQDLATEYEDAEIYLGASEARKENHVGYVRAEVIIEDEDIVSVYLAEFDTKGGQKGEDYYYNEWHDAREVMPEWFVDADSAEVDIFTGATESSNLWMEAVEDAMENAGL